MGDKRNMPEFDTTEGLALALSYLDDPSDVPCPTCGPGTIEVVAYLDAHDMNGGVVRPSEPTGAYTVVLYCHACGRAAALDLTPESARDEDGSNEDGEGRRAA